VEIVFGYVKDLQKEPSPVYLMSKVYGVVKCHKVVDKNLKKYLLR
jgi:hypothetical protein